MSWCSKWIHGNEWPEGVLVTLGRDGNVRRYVPESDQLQAENAKLRELVKDMWSAYHDGATNKEFRALPDRMRELGVEP